MPAWVLPAIAGGTAVAGGLLGARSARESAASQRRIAEAMERAQRLEEEMIRKYEGIAEPFREELYPDILSILSGDTTMPETPFYASARIPLEEQYGVARKNLEGRPGGTGALSRALAMLEARRASEVGGIPSRLYQALLGPGLGIASGKPELAVQGYGDIARTSGGMMDVYQQGINSGNALMGQGGSLLGETLYNAMLKPAKVSTPGSMFPSSFMSDYGTVGNYPSGR